MQDSSSKITIVKKYTDFISRIIAIGSKPKDPQRIRYPGFGMRMLASAIDSVLSIILMIPVFEIYYRIFGINKIQNLLASGAVKAADLSHEQVVEFITRQLASFTLQNTILSVAILSFWIYKYATPGKMLLNMEIVDAKTGNHPTKKQLIIRYLAYIISLLPLGAGFIWIHYDKKHQGWHDKIAGTVVIFRNKNKTDIV